MSITDKLTAIAENEPKVFEAGKTAEWNEFWDAFQQNGERETYQCAFWRWDSNNFYPKYNITVSAGSTIESVFRFLDMHKSYDTDENDFDLAARLTECGVKLDLSGGKGANYLFAFAYVIRRVPELNLSSSTSCTGAFQQCRRLKTIDKLILSQDGATTFSRTFEYCYELENLVIEGVIGQNGFDVHYSTLLSHDSLMSIIGALKDYTGTTGTHTCTLGTTNLAKLTDAEKAIATEKGWSLV